MKSRSRHGSVLALVCLMTLPALVTSHAAPPVASSISTPGHDDSAIGELVFKDGAPSAATRAAIYDNLDFTHAFNAFVNTFQGANMAAIRQGLLSIGVRDNEIIVFSKLMDAKSLFLTANADTVYFFSFIDLSNGPMVLEVPPGALGTLDDFWWRWVIDFGAPGPDRGQGGRYLILPPGFDGPLPEGGFYVARSRTTRVVVLGRMFMEKNDPKPAVETIKKHTKIYRYEAGAVGTSVARFLAGDARLATPTVPPPTVFHEGSGKSFSTIPPNDFSFYTLIDGVVQQEPATALDPELMGSLAAIGIVKGRKFEPDERMRHVLSQALEVANATSRSLFMHPRDPKWFYYPDSAWANPLFETGYQFETPIPRVTRNGVEPFPPTGYRQLDARTSYFYGVTGITPAMAMRLPGIGSQYLIAMLDADGQYLDGAKTYTVTLPPGIPAAKFWSFTLYDNQTRSMLDTPQRYPRAGSQSYPSPAAKADKGGTTTIYFSPKQPKGVNRGNWIQTDPEKGFFTILRLYSPLEPFFSKTWRPSEIEPVRSGR